MTDASNEMTGGQCFGSDVVQIPTKPVSAPVDLSGADLRFLLGFMGSDMGVSSHRPGSEFNGLKAMTLRSRLEAALGNVR